MSVVNKAFQRNFEPRNTIWFYTPSKSLLACQVEFHGLGYGELEFWSEYGSWIVYRIGIRENPVALLSKYIVQARYTDPYPDLDPVWKWKIESRFSPVSLKTHIIKPKNTRNQAQKSGSCTTLAVTRPFWPLSSSHDLSLPKIQFGIMYRFPKHSYSIA